MLGLFVISLLGSALADNWAVLVAGSYGYDNYRHQSDIFHTYKILTANNFDPDKIIVMAYDDIANSPSNPFPGHVYNRPDGPDVYIGSDKIDYRGENVTVENFKNVVKGIKTASTPKVLESTENDNVFIFFDDHGTIGIFGFPSGPMYADELIDTLKEMHKNKKYKKLLFYVESCCSASMFQDILPDDIDIYAITASGFSEASYATFCGDDRYKTCLSNQFSQNWMVHSENNNISTITVSDQYNHIKCITQSEVCEFGSFDIKNDYVSEYQGGRYSIPYELIDIIRPLWIIPPKIQENNRYKTIKQEDSYLFYLEQKAKEDKFGRGAVKYNEELIKKEQYRRQSKEMARFLGQKYPDINYKYKSIPLSSFSLYRRCIKLYEDKFGRLNEHNMWSITSIIYRAISEGKINNNNFIMFEKIIRRL